MRSISYVSLLVGFLVLARFWESVCHAQSADQSAPSSANSSEPSPSYVPPPLTIRDPRERQRRYREHVEQAARAYQSGQFSKTADEYLSAYQIEPEPLLLFNAAQAQRKAQNWQTAFELYQQFIAMNPKSPVIPEAEAHRASVRAKIEVERLAAERERLSARIGAAEQNAQQRSEQADRLAQTSKATIEQLNIQLLRVKDNQPIYKKKWFWGILGGGFVVAAGLSIGLGVALRPQSPDGTLGNLELMFQ